MAGSDDRSLESRLPWARQAQPAASPRKVEPAVPLAKTHRADPPPPPAPAAAPRQAVPKDPATARTLEMLRQLRNMVVTRFDQLDERAGSDGAGVLARLDQLEARIDADRAAATEAIGLLSGRLVMRIEEQVALIEAGVQARHDQLEVELEKRHEEVMARFAAVEAATSNAVGVLATALEHDLAGRSPAQQSEAVPPAARPPADTATSSDRPADVVVVTGGSEGADVNGADDQVADVEGADVEVVGAAGAESPS